MSALSFVGFLLLIWSSRIFAAAHVPECNLDPRFGDLACEQQISLPTVHNFKGMPLKVVLDSFWSRPCAERRATFTALTSEGHEYHAFGPGVSTFWDFQDSLNFTWDFNRRESSKWFCKKHDFSLQVLANESLARLSAPPNGTTMPRIGQLILSGAVDVTYVYSPLVNLLKTGHFVYLHPVRSQWAYIYFKQPSTTIFRSIFLDPFTTHLWISLVCVWILIVLVLFSATTQEGGSGRWQELCNATLWMISTTTGNSTYRAMNDCRQASTFISLQVILLFPRAAMSPIHAGHGWPLN